MYASLTTFKTAPGKRDETLKAADQVFPFAKGLKVSRMWYILPIMIIMSTVPFMYGKRKKAWNQRTV